MALDSLKTSAMNFMIDRGIYSESDADSIEKQVSNINENVSADSLQSEYAREKMDSSYVAEKSSVDTTAVSTVSDKGYKVLTEDSAEAAQALESIADKVQEEQAKQTQQQRESTPQQQTYESQRTSGGETELRKEGLINELYGTDEDLSYDQMKCLRNNLEDGGVYTKSDVRAVLDSCYDSKSSVDTCECDPVSYKQN